MPRRREEKKRRFVAVPIKCNDERWDSKIIYVQKWLYTSSMDAIKHPFRTKVHSA